MRPFSGASYHMALCKIVTHSGCHFLTSKCLEHELAEAIFIENISITGIAKNIETNFF